MKRILTLLGTVLLCLTSIILPAKAATIASGPAVIASLGHSPIPAR